MAAKLIVRVQADLLPLLANKDGTTTTQIGLRVSALVDLPVGDVLAVTPQELLPDLCPWHWLPAAPNLQPKWNPHDPEAWRLFRLDGGAPIEITAKLPAPVNLDPGLNGDFASALEQTLGLIVDEGAEAAICLPPGDQPIEHRTVFGMVESLTGSPHPVPAGLRVFTVLSVAEDMSAVRVIAIPRFLLPGGGSFDVDNVAFVDIDPTGVITADAAPVDASSWATSVQFQLRASLVMSEMTRTAGAARLVDLSKLSIGRSAHDSETGDEDYAAHLPARLAEAIDPAARLISALDGVVEGLRASQDAGDQDTFAQLRADLAVVADGKPSAVMTLLEAMTMNVFRPMSRASDAVPAVALSRFGTLARERGADGWRTAAAQSAGQIFLRMLDRDESANGVVPNPVRAPLMSYARLGATVGMTPEEIGRAPKEQSAVDTEAGLLEFVRGHWLAPLGDAPYVSRPVAAGAPRQLIAQLVSAPTVGPTMPIVTTSEAVLDAGMLSAPGPRFNLELSAIGDTAQLSLGATKLRFERTADALVTVSANGGAPIDVAAQGNIALIFALALSSDRSSLVVSFDATGQSLNVLAPDLARAPFSITLEAVAGAVSDFQPHPAEPAYAQRFADALTAQGVRTDLSLAFAGPYLLGILAGRQDWANETWPPSTEGFAQAIRDGVAALVQPLFTQLSATVANPAWLTLLMTKVISSARDDAIKLAAMAVPTATLERITMDAPPLVVRIDQFQDFGTDDAWGRLAGYGALLGRTTARPSQGNAPQEWWTLNTAELLAVAPKQPDTPKSVGLVDPVAIQVGQGGGVRQSLLSYNNRWLATGLLSDTLQNDAHDQATSPRRPERLEPPSAKAGYTLPALSFGYSFWILPYLIGHGGVLPLWLRADPANPLIRREAPGKRISDTLTGAVGDARSKTYLRSRPIGAPRFVETPGKPALPPVPQNVPPLAAELPIRPPPITLEPGQSAMFFRDVSGQRGIISWQRPAEGEVTGFRVFLGDVCKPGTTYDSKRTAVAELDVILWGTKGDSMSPEPLWQDKFNNVVNDFRLSLLIDSDGTQIISRTERQQEVPALAEDEGRFDVTSASSKWGDWHDMFLEVAVPKSGAAAQFELPVVVEIQRGKNDDLVLVDSLVKGKPLVAPEASHRSRVITLFDQINHAIKKTVPAAVTLRRPGIEFGSFERWINPALIETTGGPEKHKNAVYKALNKAYALSTREPEQTRTRPEVSFEDPAVTAFCFELVEVFPRQQAIGMGVTSPITGDGVFAPDMGSVTSGDGRLAQVEFGYGDSAKLVSSQNGVKAVLRPGRIYELRSYAVVAGGKQDFSPFQTLERLSDPVRATLRKVNIGGSDYLLASPNVVTIEVATTDLPAVYEKSGWSIDSRLIIVDRPPTQREDTARIYLPLGLADPIAQKEERYRMTRYAATASLYSQRWSWRGHPQAEVAAMPASNSLLNGAWTRALAETAFTGRRDEDVGDIIVRRLEKAHIYGGRGNLSESLPTPPSTAVFTKSLDWRAGLNLWRFGFSLTSRYAPLFPRTLSPEKLAHLDPNGAAAWVVQALPDRPSARTIARPGLALVLPLTEPLMAGGATPPLLALFNERVYANFNLADGIDVAVDVARHPFTVVEQQAELKRLKDEDPNKHADAIRDLEHLLAGHIASPTDTLKHWQEFGPDPIRTGGAHDGSPILLRTDGPLGYTFDAETEAGRFDHAGLLISPVAQDYQPWSMIKLRFRRLEAPEALSGYKAIPVSPADVNVPLAGHRFPAADGGTPIDYEGLLVEVAALRDGDEAEFALSLGSFQAPAGSAVAVDPTVTIAVSRQQGNLTIAARTWLGEAGTTSVAISPQETAALRLVVSGRERPEGVDTWTPQGDVAIKVRIGDTQAGTDVLERLDRDRWLAVNCVPLSGTQPLDGNATVATNIRSTVRSGKPKAVLKPVRLSSFTPSVWCQFAESMSVLAATLGQDEQTRHISIGELLAKPVIDNTGMTGLALSLASAPADRSPPPIRSLATSLSTDVDAQVDQILLAVVTRYVTDAFARLRERPVGVVHLTDTENRPLRGTGNSPFVIALPSDKTAEAWWGDEVKPIQRGNGGRLRFLRMLVPRSRELGGFANATTRRLSDLFSQSLLTPDDLNPADAAGQILGISQPIEWR